MKLLAFRCPEDLYKRMDKHSGRHDIDRTTVLRVSLRLFLDQLDGQNGDIMPGYRLPKSPNDLFVAEKNPSKKKN